jgi:formamidopyrimidine-DNA glycosylase
MPELPEVETIKSLLAPLIFNAQIKDVKILYSRMIKSDVSRFANDLKGKTILGLSRQGKYLIFHLSDNLILLSHLRMEGKYREIVDDFNLSPYTRVLFYFTDNRILAYEDSRCFGTMKLTDADHYLIEPPLNQLGKEPFNIDINDLYQKISKRNIPIKQLLLDQTLISGLGNIYVDEVLFLSKVHPLTPGRLITKAKMESLIHYAKQVLNQAIKDGGSTIRSYRPIKGVDGRFQTQLKAYGRHLNPCLNCHSRMVKIKIGGRGTTFCPHCQINPDTVNVIGITGMMTSGKSSLLEVAKKMGYPTISADLIVKELYQNEDIKKKVSHLFNNSVLIDNKLDHQLMLNMIITNPPLKKRLEKYIHPLVKQQLLSLINKTIKGPLFIEVPLLYQANFDDLTNYVIGVKIPYQKQNELIIARHKNNIEPYLTLASLDTFNLYESFANDILINDDTYQDFIVKGKQAIKLALAYFNKHQADYLK